jgi:hypothetical protein
MTTDRETLQIIGSWMEEGRTRLPDQVLDAVLDQLPAAPQRRPWSARRIAHMNPLAKYAIATAAVVVVAILGFNFLLSGGDSQVGAPPSAAPATGPPPLAPTSGEIEAGRYRWTTPDAEVTFTVQDGWTGDGESGISNSGIEGRGSLEHYLPGSGIEVKHVYADACFSAGALEPIGETAVDLVAALEAQKSTDAVTRDVTAGGVVGQRVEIHESPGVDRSQCTHGDSAVVPLQIWADPGETNFNALVPGGWGVVYVFDVDGERLVFRAAFGPEASDADAEAIDAVVESFEFSKP